jgi:hypothetical protein
MSKGQSPFDTPFSNNTLSNINVSSEESVDETDLITFIKGSAGNGKRLYVDSGLNYNPFQKLLSTTAVGADNLQTNIIYFPRIVGLPNIIPIFSRY